MVIAAAVTLLASPGASHGAEVVARETAVTPVAAFETYAAWSRFDGRTFRLMIWHDGVLEPAPVKPRAAAFDADLGRDARGRVVAVYSRCATTERQLPSTLPARAGDERCDLYQYDVVTRRERRLVRPSRRATSEFLPAIAGGRLVFARRDPVTARRRDARLPRLISATLGRYRERSLPRLSGFASVIARGENLGPVAVDLASGQAAVAWQHVPRYGACYGEVEGIRPTVHGVLLYDLRAGTRRVLAQDCDSYDRGASFFTPSLNGGSVVYGFTTPVTPQAPKVTWSLRRLDLATGTQLDTLVGENWLLASQTSGGWTWTTSIEADGTTAVARAPAM